MRMIATRLREGQDLKQSIERLVAAMHVSAAAVMSGVGSLHGAVLRMAGAEAGKQDIRTLDGPFEIVSLVGNLGLGRTHVHMAVSDKNGKVVGGHVKEGCIVHTTVELVLAVEDSLTFSEAPDPQTGFASWISVERKLHGSVSFLRHNAARLRRSARYTRTSSRIPLCCWYNQSND
ncbi:MAG TPA: PPC domain-containing DNA-binding protein [Candidatus Saccharimonadales bacterium]